MDVERARAFLLSLPHVVETMQWGENLVFWVGDKAIGGKMFSLADLSSEGGPVVSFAADGEHAAELLERDGLRPAPYLGRIGWVAADGWDALSHREWEAEFRLAHTLILAKLPKGTLALLAASGRVRDKAIAERRLAIAKKAAAQREPRP